MLHVFGLLRPGAELGRALDNVPIVGRALAWPGRVGTGAAREARAPVPGAAAAPAAVATTAAEQAAEVAAASALFLFLAADFLCPLERFAGTDDVWIPLSMTVSCTQKDGQRKPEAAHAQLAACERKKCGTIAGLGFQHVGNAVWFYHGVC